MALYSPKGIKFGQSVTLSSKIQVIHFSLYSISLGFWLYPRIGMGKAADIDFVLSDDAAGNSTQRKLTKEVSLC